MLAYVRTYGTRSCNVDVSHIRTYVRTYACTFVPESCAWGKRTELRRFSKCKALFTAASVPSRLWGERMGTVTYVLSYVRTIVHS